ncbi:MAG: phosphoribosyltransferase-like protein, partial [Gammaproteobacteria bacterium]
AIKDGNCLKLQSYLLTTEYLDYVDSEGKSLLALIQESSLDVNQQMKVEYDIGDDIFVINITPLHHVLLNSPSFSLKRLELLLALGANPNQIIDSEGNSVLHRYVKCKDIQISALQTLLSAKADFLMKNKKNQTPIDLASQEIAIYIKKLLITQPREHKAAIIIQRKWRLYSEKKLQHDEKTETTITLNHPLLNRIAKKPQENPPNEMKMQQWINAHKDIHKETAKKVVAAVQYISHKHFLFGLKLATKKFNQYLLSLPKTDRGYVIAIDYRDEKSGWWVTKLAENYLSFPPKKIITTTEIIEFKPNVDECHLVIFDDLSYSGNFFTHFLTKCDNALITNKSLLNIQFHLVIPFVSETARQRLKEFNIMLHYQESIPNFNVPGTVFNATTATYPAHKNPDTTLSTIAAIEKGTSVDGKDTGIAFAAKVISPYTNKG